MAMRTIAVVSDSVMPFHKGGKEARIYNLTTRLAAIGHDVHIYTMKWWDGPNQIELDGITYHAISRLYPLYDGDRRSIKQGIMFGFSGLQMLRYKFDVLEVDHMPFFPLYSTKLVSLIKRRPLVAVWHEVWGRDYWREYLGWRGNIAYAVERLSVMLPNRIVTVADQAATELREKLHYRGPLEVITNGIDVGAIQALKPAATTSDIIYTGRLLAHKNVDALIDAVAIIVRTNPDIRCLIVGDGPERANLADQIKRLGLKGNVTLAGRVESNDDVHAAMKASKVFVSPSSREGFGITTIEAFAAGLPVVTSDQPHNASRHLITPASGRVTPLDPIAIAAAIIDLLDAPRVDPQVAAVYDWDKLARDLSEVYSR